MASPTLTNFRWVFALVAALCVAGVVAVVAPRGESDTVSWLLTIGAGLVTAAAVYFWLRPRGEVEETRDRL